MDMTFIERMRSMNQEITKIRRKLMTELDRERYEHTLGVMYTAASMAMCHGTDTVSYTHLTLPTILRV